MSPVGEAQRHVGGAPLPRNALRRITTGAVEEREVRLAATAAVLSCDVLRGVLH
eukprot:gene6317-6535_t